MAAFRPRHVLVTGGAGFIGSAYVRAALDADERRVTVLDQLTYAGNLANLEDLLAASELVLGSLARDLRGRVDAATRLEGAVVVASGACVADSLLVGPVIIGEGAEVRECRLRPCGVDLRIVLEAACIDTMARPITGSVIGRHAQIGACGRAPVAHRLILGDHAAVGLG